MFTFLAAALLLQSAHPGHLSQGTREDRDGWIYIHVQGSPHDVGYEHATLLAPELDDALKAVKVEMAGDTGKDWTWFRETAYTLYWKKLDPEYQQEMVG